MTTIAMLLPVSETSPPTSRVLRMRKPRAKPRSLDVLLAEVEQLADALATPAPVVAEVIRRLYAGERKLLVKRTEGIRFAAFDRLCRHLGWRVDWRRDAQQRSTLALAVLPNIAPRPRPATWDDFNAEYDPAEIGALMGVDAHIITQLLGSVYNGFSFAEIARSTTVSYSQVRRLALSLGWRKDWRQSTVSLGDRVGLLTLAEVFERRRRKRSYRSIAREAKCTSVWVAMSVQRFKNWRRKQQRRKQ